MQDLIRNTSAYIRLQTQRDEGSLSHAYLLVYDDPVHTKTVLKEMAKTLFFAEENGFGEYDTPDQERVAKLIDGDKFADCLVYPKNEKRLNVEECEQLIEECFISPIEGDKKVVIIDRIDDALPTAQNKLLKVLEEPHEGVYFLLSARTVYPVLQTVLSRTQKLEILPFSIQEVGACMQRTYADKYDEREIKLVSALSCGSVGTAETLLSAGYYKTLIEDAFSLALTDLARLPAIAKKVGATKNKKELISLLLMIFRDGITMQQGMGKYILLTPEKQRIGAVAEKYSPAALLYALERLSAVEKEITFNANFTQAIELMMARVLTK